MISTLKCTILLTCAIVLALFLLYVNNNKGRVYKSKQELCIDFAQSYLKTIQQTDSKFAEKNPEQWKMAIAVESDLYNLCLVDLNDKSLKLFELSNIKDELNK